jgi:acyl-CoA thioester hydrolase
MDKGIFANGAGGPPWAPHVETVRGEWVDYNGHMNVAYYVLVFDHATDAVLDRLGLGEAYRRQTGCSVFVAEAHVTYEQEVNAGDRLRVQSRVLGFDGRRFILFHEMFREGSRELAATNEVLCVHVDLTTRRTAPLPYPVAERLRQVAERHAALPRPTRAGRAIGLHARRPA